MIFEVFALFEFLKRVISVIVFVIVFSSVKFKSMTIAMVHYIFYLPLLEMNAIFVSFEAF